MWLVVGLGNPGPKYDNTRHNVGFAAIDRLADDGRFPASKVLKNAAISRGTLAGDEVILAKPLTYMNLSGKAVNYWLNELKIEKSNLLVITDDIALPLGKLRMRAKGSDAGHNGLRNIDYGLRVSRYGFEGEMVWGRE